ncbi:MAG: endonuclease dU [Candidatus Bathyarchaeota archaeon]
MVRVLAVEDGGFPIKAFSSKKRNVKAFFVGVLVENFRVEDVYIFKILVDGWDATEKLTEMLRMHKSTVDVVMLPSIAYAGFNLVNPLQVWENFKIPILIVNPKKPNLETIKRALQLHFKDWEERFKIFCKVGQPLPINVNSKILYIYVFGLSLEKAEETVKKLTVFGKKPEPLRIAKKIAQGLSYVE